jgi:glycosyltransferase involved in cell wall biosynthesis
VLLVHLRKDPLFAMTIPSKTQAYLAMGRPILIGVEGDAPSLVERAGAGVLCEPQNPQSIAEAARKFSLMNKHELEQMGNNGKNFYRNFLSFSGAADRYIQIFEQIKR